MDVETQLALHGDRSADDQDPYVPYVSLDPLNDPKSFTFRIKVLNTNKECCKLRMGRERCATLVNLLFTPTNFLVFVYIVY